MLSKVYKVSTNTTALFFWREVHSRPLLYIKKVQSFFTQPIHPAQERL